MDAHPATTAPERPATNWGGAIPISALGRAIGALEHCAAAGNSLVVLDGPQASGKSTALRALARRLQPLFEPVLLSGDGHSPDALAERVLQELGAPPGESTTRDLERRAADLQDRGHPIALLVDDGETLPPETIRWLNQLASTPVTRTRVIVAAETYASLREALADTGTVIDLVRLDPSAPLTAPSRDRAEKGPQPPRVRPDSDGLLSIEELLGEEDPLPPRPARLDDSHEIHVPASERLARLPGPKVEASHEAATQHEDTPELTRAPSMLGASQPRATLRPPLAHRASAQSPAPRPAVESPSRPGPPRRHARWLRVSAFVALLIGFVALVIGAASWWQMDSLNQASGSSGVSVPRPAQTLPTGELPTVPAPLVKSRSNVGTDGSSESISSAPSKSTDLAALDLTKAMGHIIEGTNDPLYETAIRFIRRHGPDAEGYELLEKLNARETSDPEEIVRALTARSRLRAILCDAWADDPRGEAPDRLGCPGAGTRSR